MEDVILKSATGTAEMIGEVMNKSYNQAIDHAIKIVQKHFETSAPSLNLIVSSLESLKS